MKDTTALRAALRLMIQAAKLQTQPMQLSGEYDPKLGLYGQSTATLPNGGTCDRHVYMREALAMAETVLRISDREADGEAGQ